MDANKAKEILERYNAGICSEEEKSWVESWYLNQIDQSADEESSTSDLNSAKRAIWKNISRKKNIKTPRLTLYPKIAVAASISLVIGLAFYFNQTSKTIPQEMAADMVQPGGNKAYLTLADGRKINLDIIDNGELAEQSGIKLIKTSSGELIYKITDPAQASNSSTAFNTIETPIGGKYQILLPDGTKVWLNASSKLKYPLGFTANERKVELSGEGYFEVKSDKSKPFKVRSRNQVVEVLGTHFNINTYLDEPAIKTTLLEGSVKVTNHYNTSRILKPGEQSVNKSTDLEVNAVDVSQVIAWQKGDFAFEGTELRAIMRQISRWYGVEIIYEGDIGEEKFGGSISRSKDINEVLKVLEMTQGAKFKRDGRRILVMP